MAYWVKLVYERKEYVINFDRINTFCYEQNGRVTFWLPDSSIPVVINPQHNFADYQRIREYLESVAGLKLEDAYWVKILYDRKEYVVNLTSISSFCCEANGRITFWLPDATIPIIIHPATNPESYQKICFYVQQVTGYTFD